MAFKDLGNTNLNNTYYDTIYNNSFSNAEKNQLQNADMVVALDKKLSSKGENAYNEYMKLSMDTQQKLKAFYGEEKSYMNAPENGVFSFVKNAANYAWNNLNPLMWAWHGIEAYGQGLSAVTNVMMQKIENDANVFDTDTWSAAWDNWGGGVFNHEADLNLTNKYGKAAAFIAKQSLAGKTPGEIIAAYGKSDPEFLKQIESYMNDQSLWENGILEDYKQAQLSPGRAIATSVFGRRTGSDQNDTAFTGVSGTVDAMWTIFSDPLTYLTFGLETGISWGVRGSRIALNETARVYKAQKALELMSKNNMKIDASSLFKYNSVKSFWEGYTSELRSLDAAMNAKDPVSIAEAKRRIANLYPEHGTDDEIEVLRNSFKELGKAGTEGINVDTAKEFFSNAENATKLFRGRTADTTYFRRSAAVARRSRIGTAAMRSRWQKFGDGNFNSHDLRETVQEAFDDTLKKGMNESQGDSGLRLAMDIKKGIGQTPWERMKSRAYTSFSRSPGDAMIAVTDGDVHKTIDTVRNLANLIMPRQMADAWAEKFALVSHGERIVALKGLYRSVMESAGLDKTVAGKELIEKTLADKFGSLTSETMLSQQGLRIPDHVTVMQGIDSAPLGSALHDYQLTPVIGNLPWKEIGVMSADIAMRTMGKSKSVSGKTSLLHAIGGVMNGSLSTSVVDGWVQLTLFPRLGVRSSVDEAFTFALIAERAGMLESLLPGSAQRKMGQMMMAYTMRDNAVGPISKLSRKLIRKIGNDKIFKKIDPATAIPLEERKEILKKFNKLNDERIEKGLPPINVADQLKKTLAIKAIELYGKKMPEEYRGYMYDLMVHNHSSSLDAAVASTAAATVSSASGAWAPAVLDLESTMTLAQKELSLLAGNEGRFLDPREWGTAQNVRYGMFENYQKRIRYNTLGGTLNMGYYFLKHNALKEKENWNDAINQILERLYAIDEKTLLPDKDAVALRKKILEDRAVYFDPNLSSADREISEQQYLTKLIATSFTDIYASFHGGLNSFNQELLTSIENAAAKAKVILRPKLKDVGHTGGEVTKEHLLKLRALVGESGKFIREHIEDTKFEDYEKLVTGFEPKAPIYTTIEKTEAFDGRAGWWFSRAQSGMWKAMDATIQGLTRNPIVHSYYTLFREQAAGLEKQYAEDILNKTLQEKFESGLLKDAGEFYKLDEFGDTLWQNQTLDAIKADGRYSWIADMAESMAKTHFMNTAINDAVYSTLKFTDNPHVRTNLASSTRNINRFYRAIEDFYRRIYRMKDVTSRAIYRARLTSIGLNGAGMIESDSSGNEYFVMPMDNIIFAGLDTVLRTLSGGDLSFKQPQFNSFTFQLTALNPSFQDDAGLPTLSGPTAALGVLGLKGFVSQFGSNGELASEQIDNLLLGDIGDNLDLRKALTPSLVDKVWRLLDTDEASSYNNTATLSAIAYLQANARPLPTNEDGTPKYTPEEREKLGLIGTGMYGLPGDATPKEKTEYLKAVRISGHNLVAMRSILGTILPASPNTMDSIGVADYVRKNGIISVRQEYGDILKNIIDTYGSDISDPFELANSIFAGNNPRKLIYTVSRTDKTVSKMISNTDATKNWIISNRDFIDTYGDAAYFFAPSIGEYNINVYNWMQAADLIGTVGSEEFLTRVQTSIDKQLYFDVGKNLDRKLATLANVTDRELAIAQAQSIKTAIKNSNPMLAAALDPDGGFSVNDEKEMYAGLKSILSNKSAPISNDQRNRLNQAVKIFENAYSYITMNGIENYTGVSSIKDTMRERALNDLAKIGATDPFIRQIISSVFKPILKFYARDVPSAGVQRQSSFLGG